jgi:hypothetical protein
MAWRAVDFASEAFGEEKGRMTTNQPRVILLEDGPGRSTDLDLQTPSDLLAERCKKLWYAVLFQALADLGVFKKENGKTVPSPERLDAIRWINAPSSGTGSFLWICRTLDIDAWQLRLACGNKDVWKQARERLTNWNLSKYKRATKPTSGEEDVGE